MTRSRDHLYPEVAHLVGRVLPPDDARGRDVRVARVAPRVVVGVAHRNRGALRQHERHRVAIDVLPPEIPVVYDDQRSRRPVRECRLRFHATREVVRMRLDRDHFDVHRQLVMVRHDVLTCAGRDLDRLAPEAQTDRCSRRRRVGKEQSDRHLDGFRLSRRLEMQLDDEIAAWLETPLRPIRRGMRRLAGRPPEQLPFRIPRVALHAAAVSRLGVARIELAGGSRAIDTEVRMMDNARVAGPELQPPHISRTGHRNRDHERSKDVRATLRHGVRLGHADHDVGDTQPPAVLPVRHRREIGGVAFGRAARDPLLQRFELAVGEPPLVLELAFARLGLPRRHDPPAGDRGDLRGATPDILEGQQAEGTDFAGTVARGAARPDDRRDVFVERQARLPGRERGPCGEHERDNCKAQRS